MARFRGMGVYRIRRMDDFWKKRYAPTLKAFVSRNTVAKKTQRFLFFKRNRE